jgi:hypothetical protein
MKLSEVPVFEIGSRIGPSTIIEGIFFKGNILRTVING